MKLPGFNAENSLYKSDMHYQQRTQRASTDGRQAVIPQQREEAEAGGLGCAYACTCCFVLRNMDCCKYCGKYCFTPQLGNEPPVILKQ